VSLRRFERYLLLAQAAVKCGAPGQDRAGLDGCAYASFARDSGSTVSRYEEICAAHEWRVPQRYNIAQDCCDKHPPEKLAMIHERFDGEQRTLTWGELQALSNQAANLLEAHGVTRGDRIAVVLPATPETAAIFFGTWKLGALLLSMSVLYGDDGIAHRLRDSVPGPIVQSLPRRNWFPA